MKKSPGFWFFTGDWLKDPELRFCSIFARGLLMDLLCILFEAKERGYASNPDGSPRSDRQIVDAINGSSTDEKLAALAELEKSGVLSRDSRGVLFSRRLARLADISKERGKSGKKGGSKSQAKRKQTPKQNDKQNPGVSVSVSDSVSVSGNTHTSFGRVCIPADDTHTPGVELHSTWEAFRQAWNATPNTKRFDALGCPSEALGLVTDPAFLAAYPAALERLGRSTFFVDPAALTWFIRNWSRVLAGEFDGRSGRGRGSTGPRKIFQLEDGGGDGVAIEPAGGAA